jgi:predicted ATP-grasp superfamily ATP-dependent carboligase
VEHVVWDGRPQLRRPVLIAAFDGWNDAGEAATMAVRHLCSVWQAEPFGAIDPEEFHDFTETRPTVSVGEGLIRTIEWPEHIFSAARRPEDDRDAAFLVAVEPELRWRTYCAAVVQVAREIGCELVLTLGSLLADTPHTRPVRITGTVGTAELAATLGLSQSRYEGPTGIVGVLHDALRREGIASASLWASVPHYVGRSPSPAAALALVERALPLVGIAADTTSLRVEAAQYLADIDEAVMEDDDARAYVRTLEEHVDDDDDDDEDEDLLAGLDDEIDESVELRGLDELTAEVERFLRDHGGDR